MPECHHKPHVSVIYIEKMPDYSVTKDEIHEGRVWEVLLDEGFPHRTILDTALTKVEAERVAVEKRAEMGTTA